MPEKPNAVEKELGLTTRDQVMAPVSGEPKGSRLSAEEKEAMYQLAFAEGRSERDIARITGRSRNSVRDTIYTREAKGRKDEIQERIKARANFRLTALADKAVDSWMKAMENADSGKKGNHLPAKDLLTHIGAVDIAVPNQGQGTQILIQIGSDAPVEVTGDVVDGLVVEGADGD